MMIMVLMDHEVWIMVVIDDDHEMMIMVFMDHEVWIDHGGNRWWPWNDDHGVKGPWSMDHGGNSNDYNNDHEVTWCD